MRASGASDPIAGALDVLPVAVCMLDPSLAVVTANRRWYEFVGRADGDVSGRRLDELAADAAYRDVVQLARRSRASGVSARLRGLARGELRWDVDAVPRADGLVLVAVEVTGRVHEALEARRLARAAAERLTLAALDAQDAREREAAARADAEESEARFRAFAETIPHLAFIAAADGNLTYTNGRFSEYFGRDWRHAAEDWMHCPPCHPADLARTAEAWSNGIREGAPFVVESRLRRHDGQWRWHVTRVSPVRDEGGAVSMWVGTSTDVNDQRETSLALRQVNEQLQEMDQRKNEFLAVLSHELRNPLTPIRNSVYVMERTEPGGEQASHALLVIDRQVTHMSRLIDDLLDVTRISRGKIRLQREPLRLDDVVRGIGEDLRELFQRGGIRFDVEVVEAPLWVSADRTRIAQVIGNLLQNAAKFTPRGGRVRLSLDRAADGRARVEVRDDGAGIDPRLLRELFEPFVQGDETLDRSRGGLGLGLALARGLVELHGGEVSASSDGAGKGAVFRVMLPLDEGAARDAVASTSPARADRPLRVLVVEDNPDTASSLKEVLELEGHSVEVALSGAEGLRKARASLPDVVLCDIGLPEVDGYAVAAALRADPRTRSTYLVALSGYALPEDVARSREVGFDRHLAKPPEVSALERVLGEAGAR